MKRSDSSPNPKSRADRISLLVKLTFTLCSISTHSLFLAFFVLTFITIGTLVALAGPPSQGKLPEKAILLDQLKQLSGGKVRVAFHHETKQVRFIGASPDQAIPQPTLLARNTSIQDASFNFLETYGTLFGLTDPARELVVSKAAPVNARRPTVRFQQVYQNIPILAGELIVQLNNSRQIIAASGEFLPDLDLNISPTISGKAARQVALDKIAKDYKMNPGDLLATEPELWIYNPALLGGPGIRVSRLVWRMEIASARLLPLRELVLVDAELGLVTLNFNQIDTALNRVVYSNHNDPAFGLPGNGPFRTEGSPPWPGLIEANTAYGYTGDTYNFFLTEHNRDSLDNAGITLTSTVRYCPNATKCPYPNAFWNGTQMVFGEGFPFADDVVGHELTHGVTEHTSNLFYFYQSGAINESFSDIWGEFIDQTNGSGTDTPAVKWLIGEDIPSIGAVRDMADPTTFEHPDRMKSPNYSCSQSQLHGPGDNGGVHSNSGINNKAAFLMTDGGTFNGYTITGLGISKVADLYYEVQTNLLTSAADYSDLSDALYQASINLGYSTDDRAEINKAIAAVEMAEQPTNCPIPPSPPSPPLFLCLPPRTTISTSIFFDNIESGNGKWIVGSNVGSPYWFVPQTSSTIGGLAVPYATSGIGNIWGFNQGSPIGGVSDTFLAMRNSIALSSSSILTFKHAFGFETNLLSGTLQYDGGVVEYSTNGGTSWQDAGPLFFRNGYNGTIEAGGDNPLAGRAAFTADSRGYISSLLDLRSLTGQNVRFRFRIGTDNSIYDYGWFIDDVRIVTYTCHTATPTATPTATITPTPTSIPPTSTPTPTETQGDDNKLYLPLVLR